MKVFFEELPRPVKAKLLSMMSFPMTVEESQIEIRSIILEGNMDETQQFIVQNFCKAFSDEQLVQLLYSLEEEMKTDLATIQYLIRSTNGEGA